MLIQSNQRHGFTIVELLIVVVVISILAILVTLTYTQIRERAYNAQIISGVEQYQRAIIAYRALHDRYPPTSDELADEELAMTCLGVGYEDATCGIVTGKTIYEDTVFNTEMSSVISPSSANIGEVAIQVGGEGFVGAVYGIDDVVGGDRGRTIQWALLGEDVDCELPGSYGYNRSTSPPTTACEILLEPIDD